MTTRGPEDTGGRPGNSGEAVVSLDGQRAIAFLELEATRYRASNRDGFHVDGTVRLRPGEQPFLAQWFISGTLASFWDYPNQTYRWGENFQDALPDLARVALALHLDENPVPPVPGPNEYALRLEIQSPLIEYLRQTTSGEAALRRYGEAKIYWSWRFGLEPTRFLSWEGRRLGASLDELERAVFADEGSLWDRDGAGEFRARPALAAKYRPEPGKEEAVADRYDVALSFAGEQREFVESVAIQLKEAGLRVFYDGLQPLWGKDLSIEFERVYRRASRYIVIFISREYVEKAWPNLERQHALSGRIERMDDSVLPARFHPVELPGLPGTVGYVDIGDRTPGELAKMILDRLTSEDG